MNDRLRMDPRHHRRPGPAGASVTNRAQHQHQFRAALDGEPAGLMQPRDQRPPAVAGPEVRATAKQLRPIGLGVSAKEIPVA